MFLGKRFAENDAEDRLTYRLSGWSGQSLSDGSGSNVQQASRPPYAADPQTGRAFMVDDAAVSEANAYLSDARNDAVPASFEPSGLFPHLMARDHAPLNKWISAYGGKAGTVYTGLKKGTAPWTAWMADVTAADTFVPAGATLVNTSLHVVHGASDSAAAVNQATYLGYLVEWLTDYTTDVNAITGRSDLPVMLIDQLFYSGGTHAGRAAIVAAQIQAAADNARIYLVGPKYNPLVDLSADGVHPVNVPWHYVLAEQHAKVLDRILGGEDWKPLQVESVVATTGNRVVASFNVPRGGLVFEPFECDYLSFPGMNGFVYEDDGTAEIRSMRIQGDTVEIDLTAAPSTNPKLHYAVDPTDAYVYPSAGFLRDEDTAVSDLGYPLYNRACLFSMDVS